MGINSKREKVSGSSAGKAAPMKKDGYAAGRVPEIFIGSKVGKTNKDGYSGPNVARGSFGS